MDECYVNNHVLDLLDYDVALRVFNCTLGNEVMVDRRNLAEYRSHRDGKGLRKCDSL